VPPGEDWSSNGLVMTPECNEGQAEASGLRGADVSDHNHLEGDSAALFATPDCGPAEERVERPSVDAVLDRAVKRRICVVIGAAGWGKTTAVANWSRGRRTAWLRYEDHEGNAESLLASLFGALRPHVSLPAPAADTATWDTRQVRSSLATVCAWLRSSLSEDLVLVLDDLHGLAPHSDAAAIVETLCQRAPERLHLVLISRSEPPFSLHRLRGRGLVAEICAPNLAFDVADIQALLRQTMGEDTQGLSERVWERTCGWPTVVHFAVEILRVVQQDQRLDALVELCQPGDRLHDYLAEEVVGAAPEWVQQLLRRLAILGEVTSPTEIAREVHAPSAVLAELSRQGLLQRPNGVGWELVAPLRQFFENEASSGSFGEWKALHRMAANKCIEQGVAATAIRHLLAAGDHAGTASLLVNHGGIMVERGQVDAVLAAADLPAEYLDDPRIQQVLGHARLVRGQWAQALQHFRRAGQDKAELDPALAWRVGVIAFAQGEFDEVHTLIGRTRLDREGTLDETRVLALAASAHRMTGDLVGSRKMALETRTAARRCGEPRAWSAAHHVFALLAAAEGDWWQADAHCTEAIRNAEACQDLLQLTWTRACRAFHQFEAGAPRHALTDAGIALSLAQRCDNPFVIAHVLTTRGRARARLGMLDEAADDFAAAIDLFKRIGSRFLAWSLCGLGDLYRTRGQLIRARASYEEALSLAEPNRDVFGRSSALMGLARITAADDPALARARATRAVELREGLRKVPALLTHGWVELMAGNRQGASADAERAAVTARQRLDDPGLAEAITLSVLACPDPTVEAARLRESIDIWRETGCCLEEAATRLVAARIDTSIPHLDAHLADRMLRDHGVDVESRRAAGPLGVLVRSRPAVFIQTLGTFRVIRDGVPIPSNAWKSKKARDLLKILVARRRPTPRDQLIELLWPEAQPSLGSNRLSARLSNLREVLQHHTSDSSPLVTTADGAVSLNPAEVRVDVEGFLAQAAAALDADQIGTPDATTLLTAALAAHTGDFLEDDPYQQWAIELDEEVRATHLALLRALARRMRDIGDTEAVVHYTLRLLQQDHYDEQAHLSLIAALLEARRVGQAHRYYHNYVRRMTEIGISPRPLPNIQASRREAKEPPADRPRPSR
jgi:ATP/maltotriose-dependent transcriptional regulator MalT/DNA-binding SARP family transcriptional activator